VELFFVAFPISKQTMKGNVRQLPLVIVLRMQYASTALINMHAFDAAGMRLPIHTWMPNTMRVDCRLYISVHVYFPREPSFSRDPRQRHKHSPPPARTPISRLSSSQHHHQQNKLASIEKSSKHRENVHVSTV
jgi:hypothetical protein